MRDQIVAIEGEYRRYKALADAAMAQLGDEELFCLPAEAGSHEPSDNTIAVIVTHVAGNLESRFSDFLTTDGEKPWRHREEEFDARTESRDALLERWNRGWTALLTALAELADAHLPATVTIRSQPLRVDAALYRSLAHTSYHVGQIVYIAKAIRGQGWRSLSIPRGQSAAYRLNPRDESPAAHVKHLSKLPDR